MVTVPIIPIVLFIWETTKKKFIVKNENARWDCPRFSRFPQSAGLERISLLSSASRFIFESLILAEFQTKSFLSFSL